MSDGHLIAGPEHRLERLVDRGHHARNDDSVDRRQIQRRQGEEVADQNAPFVRRLFANGAQTPPAGQFLASERSDGDVGVSYIESQQHVLLFQAGRTPPARIVSVLPLS